ncbi:Tetratricopeptide repeat-containing protein [Catalinimonas alkaloidigena]|uniref:histidine kinase n=1 Tax=Catalinimonas alkaloidigena TaxID=1075417 RepID=A0A1G8ZVF1_9BACT|nr:tetratricopeptide repeat protein [Catalinimonas alkaloidigena]SDK18971.1 Tetratricopeptide repeat-containing protein [Catalinimonas alkaloidigena]
MRLFASPLHYRWIGTSLLLWLLGQTVCAQMALSRQDSFQVAQSEAQAARYRGLGDFREASHHFNDIAMIYWKHSQYQRAIDYYLQSLSLNAQLNNENGMAMINSNLGMLYADVQQYEKAEEHFKRTLEARKAAGERIGQISALYNLGVVLNRLARYDEAIARLEEALTLAKELSSPEEIRSCYGMLAETYSNAGNAEKSLQYFNLYRSFHELVQRDKEEEQQREVEAAKLRAALAEKEEQLKKFQLQQTEEALATTGAALLETDSVNLDLLKGLKGRELEIAYLEKAQKINNLERAMASQELMLLSTQLKQDRMLLWGVAILALVVLVYSFFLFRAHRRVTAQNKLLQAQQAEIEAQARRIREINEGLEIKVQERTAELERRNEQLSEHLYLNSHKLRAPLARMLGLVQLLQATALNKEEQRQVVKSIGFTARELDSVTHEINTNLANNFSS